MKLIVGLGNPGRKYEGTRHNVGYEVIAELARRYQVGRPRAKFNGELAETNIKNEKSVLLCPLTYMNRSGSCVRAVFDFYKLSLADLLVVCDDLNLPTGRLRLRPGGSAGGQNGLKDIIQQLGDQKFARLRLGIDRPPPRWDASDYVLGRFSGEDRQKMDTSVKRAADAVESWVADGIQLTMTRFNADPAKPKTDNKNNKNKTDRESRASATNDAKPTGSGTENKSTDKEDDCG